MLHPVQGSTLLIDADCGLGKTTAIRRYMSELFASNSQARVLVVSVRIVHALDLAAGLAECGVEPSLYTDYKGRERELVQQRCVVISAEQCMHLSLSSHRWDLLVLDEVRSLCDKFKRHSTLTSYRSVAQLQAVYAGARYCIAADADCSLDNGVMHLLTGMHCRTVHTLKMSRKKLKRTLFCEFDGSAVQRVPAAFTKALQTLGDGRLAVVCGGKTVAQKYALACIDAGFTDGPGGYVLYHGGVSAKKKSMDFADPDAAWANRRVVIYNTCVTVGIDPTTTVFTKMFMHTSRVGGSLRDLFQGACRPGRRDGLLLDTTVHCVLHCAEPRQEVVQAEVKRRRGNNSERLPTEETTLAAVLHAKRAAHNAARADMQESLLGTRPQEYLADWIDSVRAAVDCQSELDRSHHWAQFQRLAAHRGWSIEIGGKMDASGDDESVATDDCELMTPEQLYHELKTYSEQESECTADAFFTETAHVLEQSASERSADDALAADVYYGLGSVRSFDLSVDAFKFLRTHRSEVDRYVRVRYCSRRDIRLDSVMALMDDAHPELHHRDVAISRASRAEDMVARALGIPSFLQPGITLPQAVVDALNAERQDTLAAMHWEVYTHSKKDHHLNGMTFREIAAKNPLVNPENAQTTTICEWIRDHKPGSKLASYLNAIYNTTQVLDEATKRSHELAGELQKALAMLDKPCGVGLWKAIMRLASSYGMMACKQTCEKTVNGRRVRNLFQGVALKLYGIQKGDQSVPVMQEVLDHYKLRAGDTFLPLSEYPEWSRMLDCDQAEQAYTATMQALNRNAVEVRTNDVRFETIDKAALQHLYKTVASTDQEARRAVELFTREAIPHPELDDVLQIQTSYHRKYGFGRRYGDEPSLQMAPRRVRGQLAARFYHDIDMVNAHFHIMHEIALSHGIELEATRRVVTERDSVLQEVQAHYRCGRATAKELLIAVLNGGHANTWVQDEKVSIDGELVRRIADPTDDLGHVEIVDELLLEYARMQQLMFKTYGTKLQSLMDSVQRARPEKNKAAVRRSVFSMCLQNEEDRILQAMEAYYGTQGYEVHVLIYDGCLITRKDENPFPEAVMRGCERAVHEATGYTIQLAEKCLRCEVVCSKCRCETHK